MRLVFCSIAQKWLILGSKLKLEVKTKGQELSNEVLCVSAAQILLKIWLKTKSVIFLNFINFVILFSDFSTLLQKWKTWRGRNNLLFWLTAGRHLPSVVESSSGVLQSQGLKIFWWNKSKGGDACWQVNDKLNS